MIKPRNSLIFKDQIEAANALFETFPADISSKKPVLLSASLDSVILVDEIAKKLKTNYDIFFTEAIHSQINKECVIGMVSQTEEIVYIEEFINSFEINMDYLYGEASRTYEEQILANIYKYRKGEKLTNLQDKDVILLDEGCETGLTAITCLKSIISLNPRSVAYATPLIASDTYENLSSIIDKIYTVHNIANFVNVDFYYEEKIKLSNLEIISKLKESKHYLSLKGEKIDEI